MHVENFEKLHLILQDVSMLPSVLPSDLVGRCHEFLRNEPRSLVGLAPLAFSEI